MEGWSVSWKWARALRPPKSERTGEVPTSWRPVITSSPRRRDLVYPKTQKSRHTIGAMAWGKTTRPEHVVHATIGETCVGRHGPSLEKELKQVMLGVRYMLQFLCSCNAPVPPFAFPTASKKIKMKKKRAINNHPKLTDESTNRLRVQFCNAKALFMSFAPLPLDALAGHGRRARYTKVGLLFSPPAEGWSWGVLVYFRASTIRR